MSIREVTARIANLSIIETKVHLEIRSIFPEGDPFSDLDLTPRVL